MRSKQAMTRNEAFFELIGFLDRESIRYALAGDTDGYPEKIDGDIDIIVDKPGLETFHRRVFALEKRGIAPLQRFRHEITAFYYVLAFGDAAGAFGFVKPDICSDYYRHGRKLLDAGQILNGRRFRPCDGCPGGGYYILSPQDECAYYLLKKIGKGSISSSQAEHLRSVIAEAPDLCAHRIAQFGAAAEKALQAIANGEEAQLAPSLPTLRSELLRSGRLGRTRRIRDAVRKTGRIARPTGFVAVLGPDSATTAAELINRMAPAFRRTMDASGHSKTFLEILKAKVASSLIILDHKPQGAARLLVDCDLSSERDPVGSVIHALRDRLYGRLGRPGGAEAHK